MDCPDLDYLFKPLLVYSFSNYCGRYELLCCPPNETEDDFRYEVRLVSPPEETSEDEEEEDDDIVIFGDGNDEEWARYKAEVKSGNFVPFEERHTSIALFAGNGGSSSSGEKESVGFERLFREVWQPPLQPASLACKAVASRCDLLIVFLSSFSKQSHQKERFSEQASVRLKNTPLKPRNRIRKQSGSVFVLH